MTENTSMSGDAVEFKDPLSDYEPVAYDSELHRALAEDTVDALTSQPCIEVEPSATVGEAIDRLHAANASSLLVVSDGKVVGIFTGRDVLEKVAERYANWADTAVGEVMTANPTVVYQTDPVAIALAAIAVAGHRHVPVLAIDGTSRGILSPRRVFDFIEKHFDQ
ncbi:MAG: CBS domain-containing protein [Pirellulaceae bacterium]|nr:CBS domain-containing protein [Pirellulaceae bacterium]